MTYEDIISWPVRKAIMWSLFALFFVLAPTITFYTAGWRYNWFLRRLEQTGVISIDAWPRDADVYLNGIKITASLPLRLGGSVPGTYHIKIQKPGYKSWKKDITVESRQSTYIKNIFLFKDSLPALLLKDSGNALERIYPSFDGHYILLVLHRQDMYDVRLLDMATMRQISVARYALTAPPAIVWSPVSDMAMLQTQKSGGYAIQLMDATTGEISSSYALSKNEVRLRQWSKGPIPALYVEHNAAIQKLTLQYQTELAAITLSSTLWYIDDTSHVWFADSKQKIIYKSADADQSIALPSDKIIERIVDINSQRIILATNHGLFVHRNFHRQVEQENLSAASIRYSNDTGEWLVWSPWELWSIYDNGDSVLLNRSSEYTADVWPMDEYGVILLATKASLTAFNPGYYVNQELWRGESNQLSDAIEQVGVNKDKRQIYFLGTVGKTRGLFTLDF